MKWVLFSLRLFALLVATNVLFWMPGNYDWFNLVAAGIAISLAVGLAWLSSKKFVGKPATLKELVLAPPAVIWIFVVLLFCCSGLVKMAVYH